SEAHDMIVLDRAGGGDDCRARAIAAVEIAVDRRPVEGPDAFPRAEDRPADRLVRPGGRGDEIEHQVVGRIVDRPDLLDDDILFPFELVGIERAVGEEVADHVERESGVAPQNPSEVARPLDPGLRVEVAPDILDRLRDLAGASPAGALERHVLDEMREPVLVRALVAGSRGDEDPDRRRLHMGAGLGDDRQPRGKVCDLSAHAAARAVWRTKSATARRSLGRTAIFSLRSIRSLRRSGSGGLTPVARSTASGNFAGWAVARAMTGVAGALARAPLAAAIPIALCGSTIMPLSRQTRPISSAQAASSTLTPSKSARMRLTAGGGIVNEPLLPSSPISATTVSGSRPEASNRRRSKFEET